MPSENATFERIQKEISEEIQREKEIKRLHEQYLNYKNNNNNNTDNESSCGSVNGDAKSEDSNQQPLSRAQSASSLLSGEWGKQNGALSQNGAPPQNGTPQNGTTSLNGVSSQNGNHFKQNGAKLMNTLRLFTPNPQTKGVMHRFLKSRGKITNLNTSNGSPVTNGNGESNGIANRRSWTMPEFIEPTKVTIDPSKCVRKGFVPVEQRMKKEFQDMHVREIELRKERRKSQPDFLSLCEDIDEAEHLAEPPLRAARSMAQLYTPEDFSDAGDSGPSAPNSLKPARSLAELCDVEDDTELLTPSSLISKFETIIKKNQQART